MTGRAESKTGGQAVDRVLRHLFTPIKIGELELKNRIIMPPMIERLAVDGMVTQAVKDFYGARARGGVGLIVLTPGIIDESMASSIQLGIYEDRFVPKLKELTDVVHECGAAIGIELMHLGRQGEGIEGYKPVAASPIPWAPHEQVPRELTTAEIEDLVEKFADGARRARDAGFDLVELHACHGYLLSGFLSPHTNLRTDRYGGDVAGRARFVVEIVQRIKAKAGSDFPVSCRINGTDHIPGGVTPEMACETARILEEAGADLVGVSSGAYGSYPVIVPPYDQPYGCNVELAHAVKRAVNVPVAVAGRLDDPWVAEEVLASGKADLIAIARGLVADPDLPDKVQEGRFQEIRKCIACNVCIDYNATEPIQCTVNPEAGREREMEIVPVQSGRKVLVIGGGLAGLEAARVAALRGHRVVLYEEDDQIGGQWRLAAAPPHKQGHLVLLEYLAGQLEKLGVEQRLGRQADAATVDEIDPDVVIVATGGEPVVPRIPGVGCEGVLTAWEVLGGREVGQRVLVVGGGMTGLETAELLAERGREVTVVEQLVQVGADMGATVRWHMMKRIKGGKVRIVTSTQMKEIRPGLRVVVSRGDRDEEWDGFDAVVLACGVRPRNEIVGQVGGKEVHVIGDASQARKGLDAMRDGAEVGRRI